MKTQEQKSISPIVPLAISLGGIMIFVGTMAVIGFLNARKHEESANEGDPDAGNDLSASLVRNSIGQEVFKCKSNTYPLQYRTCHPDVMVLQRYLKRSGADLGNTGKYKDGIDGEFGIITGNAASKYLNKKIFYPEDMLTIRKKLQTT